MNFILTIWLQFFLSLFSQFNGSLENAFLQNDAHQLAALLPSSAEVMISLSEPLNFSDCFSPAQARVVVDKMFNQVTTQEFIVDQPRPLVWNGRGAIISARWSFISRNNGKKFILRLYIYISLERVSNRGSFRALIREIRAERL